MNSYSINGTGGTSSAQFDAALQKNVPDRLVRMNERMNQPAPDAGRGTTFGVSLQQALNQKRQLQSNQAPGTNANQASDKNTPADAGRAAGRERLGIDPQRLVDMGIPSSRIAPKMDIEAEVAKSSQHRRLFEASQEMESMFVNLMLKQMRKNVNKTKLIDGGRAEEIFEDMLYDEYSKKIANTQNLGLAENLYGQLSQALK